MLNLFENIVQKRRYLIVDEKNLMAVLTILDDIKQKSRIHSDMGMEIGKCKVISETEAWFVEFKATTGQWRELITILKEHGYKLVLNEKEYCYVKKSKGL